MRIKWILLVLFLTASIAVGAYFIGSQQQTPIVRTVDITLNVLDAPDFNLIPNITEIDSPINRTIGFAITVEKINDFAGEVSFEVTGLPPAFLISYFPSNTITVGGAQSQGISVEIVIPDDPTLVGTYQITVTAESTTYN